MRRYALRDDQWDRIKNILPGREGHVGGTSGDNRLFVDAVLYRYRGGIPWRDLPERFGHYRAVHQRHMRWSKSGVWEKVFKVLAEDLDNEYAMIDSTSAYGTSTLLSATAVASRIRACPSTQCRCPKKDTTDQCIRRSKGGLSTKIHATCDALGNPTGFHLTAGQAHDLEGADALLNDIKADAFLADKAYDADERVLNRLHSIGCNAVIPPKSNRKEQREYDQELYKARHLIENFFAKLKQYRAIATRYDKTATAFLGAIHLSAAVVWLN